MFSEECGIILCFPSAPGECSLNRGLIDFSTVLYDNASVSLWLVFQRAFCNNIQDSFIRAFCAIAVLRVAAVGQEELTIVYVRLILPPAETRG